MSSVREAASGPPPPPNRYSQLAQPEQLAIWHNTFRMFDRDGGGDVDLREIGLMFRQLGQHPTEREMRLLIEEVDADGSGTVDFEEFCNLMLRQERSVRTPEWLADLLPADLDADDPLRLTLPNHVVLTEPKFEAARKIQNKMKGKKAALGLVTGGRATSPTTAPGFSGAPSKVQPFERGDLTRDQLMMVVDLLPSASHVTVASVAGHDDHFGPFIAAELAWRLATSSRTNLTSLDLSFDGIGDDGAVALARTLRENQQLLTLDLSGNSIGERGASAIMGALCMAQEGGKRPPLRVLTLDENRLSNEMLSTIQTQLLLNNLDKTVSESTVPFLKGGPTEAQPVILSLLSAGGINADAAEAARGGMELGEVPACRLTDEWLAHAHIHLLRGHLMNQSIKSLHVSSCERFTDQAFAALLAYYPPPITPVGQAPVPYKELQLTRLRVSSCGLSDGITNTIITAIRDTSMLVHLKGLALDDNAISLSGLGPNSPAAAKADKGESPATLLGAALRRLTKLEQLDLSHNVLMKDTVCAELCTALLAAKPADGTSTPPSLKLLHLGNTGAGNSTSVACSDALAMPGCVLSVLCLSGEVGDVGARAIGSALGKGCALKELYLGNRVSDLGVEKLCTIIGDAESPNVLEVLCLGGIVRGDVLIKNKLEARSAALIGQALRSNVNGPLQCLRLTGNSMIGGHACLGLIGSLQNCSKLKALHLEGCGLTKPEMAPMVESMNEVWCLHELIIDRAIPEQKVAFAANRVTAPAASPPVSPVKPGGKPAKAPKLLSLQQRMTIGKILEDNRTMGPRRVENFKLARSLEEVQWVFNSYCMGMPKEVVDGGMDKWDGAACGIFVRNLGLPQYEETFTFNLKGKKLTTLAMSDLSMMGVASHAEQKEVMGAVRSLLHAYERRERVAKANALWSSLLTGGASGMKAAQNAAMEAALKWQMEQEGASPANPRSEKTGGRTSPTKPRPVDLSSVNRPASPPHGGVHTFQRTLSPGRKHIAAGANDPNRSKHPRAKVGGRRPRWADRPLPIIEQPAGVQSIAQWPKKSAGPTSAAYATAAANASAARQANFAVAGSQLNAETRELFRGLMHTLETYPDPEQVGFGSRSPAHGAKAPALPTAAQQFNAATSRRLGGSAANQRLDAVATPPGLVGMHSGTPSASQLNNAHALHGACEAVIATRHCGSGAMAYAPEQAAYAPGAAPAASAINIKVPADSSLPNMAGNSHATANTMNGSRSSGALRKPHAGGTPVTIGLSSSHSVSEIQHPRKAYSQPPRFSASPASHGHPRVGIPPQPVLTSWTEAAAEGRADSQILPAGGRLTAKERMLQKAEAALNERLASAAASLQSFKMATLEVAEQRPEGAHHMGMRSSPPKRHGTGPKSRATSSEMDFSDHVVVPGAMPRAASSGDAGLVMKGKQVASSNEKLGMILSDLMR